MDLENLFGAIGTKEGVSIKIKWQLMSNDDFIQCILRPELATKFCMENDDITFKKALLKLYENDFLTLHHSHLMDQVFIIYCV